jgi:hypothetical protein
MQRRSVAVAMLAVLVGLAVAACGGGGEETAEEPPAKIESVGNGLKRVTLTEAAAQRLGIETARVSDGGAAGGVAMPYSAVLYDLAGHTWAFTNPSGLVYVRAHIAVDHIAGQTAFLSAGPPAGTAVVTVGAAELLGAEIGVGEGE